MGRLLITFLLCTEGALHEPTLYLSLYLKQNRARYYELLQAVRQGGDWEEWLRFFLEGVEQTSNQAASSARRLMALGAKDAHRVQELGRAASTLFMPFRNKPPMSPLARPDAIPAWPTTGKSFDPRSLAATFRAWIIRPVF